MSSSGTSVVPVASAPGRQTAEELLDDRIRHLPLRAIAHDAGQNEVRVERNPDCERIVAAMSTSTVGIVYGAEPRSVVRNGSTLWQFRGSGLSMRT